MDIHVFLHNHDEDAMLRKIAHLIKSSEEKILMALTQAEKDLIAKMDTATTAISDKIDALINNPPSTVDEFIAALQPIADHLDALGKPANPFPPAP